MEVRLRFRMMEYPAQPVESVNSSAYARHPVMQLKPSGSENFIWIGQVQGPESSLIQEQYEFTYRSPEQGANLHRLKVVDFDGISHFPESQVVTVPMPDETWRISPNPVHHLAKYNGHNAKRLEILDMSGQILSN